MDAFFISEGDSYQLVVKIRGIVYIDKSRSPEIKEEILQVRQLVAAICPVDTTPIWTGAYVDIYQGEQVVGFGSPWNG